MSDDAQRIHPPTPKRKKEFRDRGEIGLSKDLTSALAMGFGLIASVLFWDNTFGELSDHMRRSMQTAGDPDTAVQMTVAIGVVLRASAPVMVGALTGYLFGAGLQLGWPPALKKPSFDLSKPFKIQSIAGIISPKAAGGRMLKATAKVVLLLGVVTLIVYSMYNEFMTDPALTPGSLARRHGDALVRLGAAAVAVLISLAGIDYIIQRRGIAKKMKMTPEEVKREHKNQEGDPQIRNRRRQAMRDLAQRRISTEVASADVVIVNPTHYAVALRYQNGVDSAPKVVAKGADEVAARIRELARGAGVPIVSRPPLARFLYRAVPEGRDVPSDVFHAVAEVLAYVYSLRQGARA